jgi:hypothetical protein
LAKEESGQELTPQELARLPDHVLIDRMKQRNKPKPAGITKKAFEQADVKEFLDIEKKLPVLHSNEQNLNDLSTLSDKIKGAGATTASYIPGTDAYAAAEEFDKVMASQLKPIFEVFNPVGAIPFGKILWAQKTFSAKSTDYKGKQDAAINALKRLNDQAIKRNEQRRDLLVKISQLDIPEEMMMETRAKIMDEFEQESAKMFDQFTDQLAVEMGEQPYNPEFKKPSKKQDSLSGLPPVTDYPDGKKLRNPETGEMVQRVGDRWEKI